MVTYLSNRVFFAVRETPAERNGWVIVVKDPNLFTTTLAVFNEWVQFSISPQLNDNGAGSITLDLDSPFWATTLTNGQPARFVRDNECLWEAYEDGILRFQWFGMTDDESFINDDLGRGVTISGPGVAEALKWGIILRPGFPAPIPANLAPDTSYSGDNANPAYYWGFSQKWPAMRMWWTLFKAANARGTCNWFNLQFTDTTDSAGAPWEYIPIVLTEEADAFQPQLGTTLRDFLDECTGQDDETNFAMWADWHVWPGFKLDVRKTIGSHREKEVIFFEGQTVTKNRTRVREEIRNVIIVRDVNGKESVAVDASSIAQWNRREKLEDGNKNVTDSTRRNAIASIYLQQQKDEQSQWEIEVPGDLPGHLPFHDYDIGDWIGIGSYNPDGTNQVDAYRCMAISVSVDITGYVTVQLTLQSVLESFQKDLKRQLTRIINNLNEVADDPLSNVTDGTNTTGGTGTTGDKSLLVKNPDGSYQWDSGFGSGGVRVFIQDTDPYKDASTGDFWYSPNGASPHPINSSPVYVPEQTPATIVAADKFRYKPIPT